MPAITPARVRALLGSSLVLLLATTNVAAGGNAAVVASGQPVSIADGFRRPMELAWIAPGTFTMGTPDSEAGHRANESPQTRVEITQGFWMARHEVTHGQWKDLMGSSMEDQARKALDDETLFHLGAGTMPLRTYFGLTRESGTAGLLGSTGDDVPMIWISWDECVEFARRLTQRMAASGAIPSDYEFRLPTEAEWEYAARAGTLGATHAGDMALADDGSAPVLDGIAWYASNSGEGYDGKQIDASHWITQKEGAAHGSPRDVGTRAPNAWGLYDMLGNAAEWCSDWYAPLPGGQVRDWKGGSENPKGRIRRGGGWSTFARNARSGYRNAHEGDFRWVNLGFRVVLAKKEAVR